MIEINYTTLTVIFGLLIIIIYWFLKSALPSLANSVFLFIEGQALFGGVYFICFALLGQNTMNTILPVPLDSLQWLIGFGGVALLFAGYKTTKKIIKGKKSEDSED